MIPVHVTVGRSLRRVAGRGDHLVYISNCCGIIFLHERHEKHETRENFVFFVCFVEENKIKRQTFRHEQSPTR